MTQEIKNKDHRIFKILAVLFEQRICDFHQLHKLSMSEVKKSVARQTIAKLQSDKLIQSSQLERVGLRPISIYSLTSVGYQKLRWKFGYLPEYKKIKTQHGIKDLLMTDIRIIFQQHKECQYFLSQNLLQLKIFEDSTSTLAILRNTNPDAAFLFNHSSGRAWCAVEFEYSLKAGVYYKEKFRRWYSNENLRIIFVMSENQKTQKILIEIEKEIYPNEERKILFTNCADLTANETELTTFVTSSNIFVDLHKDKNQSFYIPSLQPMLEI